MNQYANDFTETVQTYYNDLKKYKPLSKTRERRLLRLCKRGDKKAKNELIESNLKFVFDIAKRYTGRGISIGELISEGNMGLLKAIDKFDENQDVKFISYAVWWIRHAMLDTIKKNKLITYVEFEKEESNDKIIENRVADEEDEMVSPDDIMYSNEHEEYKHEVNENQKKIINSLIPVLNEREKFVIENYYGLNDGDELTLIEIGNKLGLSSERVRQIKISGIRKLRSKIMLCDNIEEIFR